MYITVIQSQITASIEAESLLPTETNKSGSTYNPKLRRFRTTIVVVEKQ
jgi:hypothetical protein